MADSNWTRLGGINRDTLVATGANVESYVAAQIGAAYKAKGTIAFADLPAPAAALQGFVYDISDAFTTTASFVEGAGKSFPAGTNVVCVNTTGSTYAWDVLTGMADLSGKQDKITASGLLKGNGSGGVTAAVAGTDYVAPVSGKGLSTNDYTTEEKEKLAGIAAGANAGFASVTGTSGSASADSSHTAIVFTGTNITAEVSSGPPGAVVSLAVPDGSTAAKGVVKMSDSTSSDVSTTAATSKAVKAAYDRGSAGVAAAGKNTSARSTTLKNAIDTMYSRATYPDKQSLYTALANMDDLADTLADLIIALRAFCDVA